MLKLLEALLVVAFMGTSSYAMAQQTSFVPYTIDEKNHQALLNYLGEQPAKFSMPLINSLNQLEFAAQSKKATDDAAAKKKADEAKKPSDKK